jgi:hypothetical protein
VYVSGVGVNDGLWVVKIACGVGERYGRGTAGSGGLVPVIDWDGGIAQVGNAGFRLAGRDMLGGSAAVLLLGARAAAIGVAGIELAVDPTQPLVSFVMPTGGGGSGQGSASMPIAIASNPALAGGTVYAQWLTLDPAAPAGLAASRGMRLTLCR